jgi:hypothetical protein
LLPYIDGLPACLTVCTRLSLPLSSSTETAPLFGWIFASSI